MTQEPRATPGAGLENRHYVGGYLEEMAAMQLAAGPFPPSLQDVRVMEAASKLLQSETRLCSKCGAAEGEPCRGNCERRIDGAPYVETESLFARSAELGKTISRVRRDMALDPQDFDLQDIADLCDAASSAPSSARVATCDCQPHEFCEVCTPKGWKPEFSAVTDEMVDKALGAAKGAMVDTRRFWTDGDRAAVRAMLEAVIGSSAAPAEGVTDLELAEAEAQTWRRNAEMWHRIADERSAEINRLQSATGGRWERVPVACHNLGIDFIALRAEVDRLGSAADRGTDG